MFSFLNIPAKIIKIVESNISPGEIAFGVCLGMFLGFIPLNGSTALLLTILFFVLRINRTATLLTMPLFKTLYLLGVSNVCDAIGSYVLERADFLTGFWRFVTNLPVIAYLDINRTMVAGGIILSIALFVPVYFLSRMIAAAVISRYTEKIQKTALAKWVSRFKHAHIAVSLIGSNASSTLSNVGSTVKTSLAAKVKSVIIKPKAAKKGILARINIKGVAIVAIALFIINVATGLVISPAVGSMILDAMNKSGAAKITAEKINVWPLTLSFSMKDLKVYDPKSPDKRIVLAKDVSVSISPIALLCKRLVIQKARVDGAQIDVEGHSDGSYNIQSLSGIAKENSKNEARKSKPERNPAASIFGLNPEDLWRRDKDMFGKVYDAIKKKLAKKSTKVTRVTQDLPRGRLIKFKTPADMYLFEIKDLGIDGQIDMAPYNAKPIELKDARVHIFRAGFDPDNGFKFDGAQVRGELLTGSESAGKVDIYFLAKGQNAESKIALENIDLNAVRFVYEQSLPVHFIKGRASLNSRTQISGDALDSRNSITLSQQTLEPKTASGMMVGFVPIAVVCDALNKVDPATLKFDITGTLEKPQFSGFQDTLLALIKPYIANIGEDLKTKGVNALGGILRKKLGSAWNGGSAQDAVK